MSKLKLSITTLIAIALLTGCYRPKPFVIIGKEMGTDGKIYYVYQDDFGIPYQFNDTIVYKIGDTIK